MSDRPEISGSLEEQAAQWVARVYSDEAVEADWLALETWLSADPAHISAYDRAEAVLRDLEDQAPALTAALTEGRQAQIVTLADRRPRRLPAWAIPAGAIAASVVVALASFNIMGSRGTLYETAPGETRELALADGTRISLNGASRLRVRLSGEARRVVMEDAEAAFDVAHDAARPFLIDLGDTEVRVVGTAFNIDRNDAGLTVTVRRGVVEVTTGESAPVRLTAGQELALRDGSPAQVREADAETAFAWQEGRLIYQAQPLSEIAADLSRHFDRPVSVDAQVADLPFTGVLVLDEPDAMLVRLESFLPIKARRTEGGIALSAR